MTANSTNYRQFLRCCVVSVIFLLLVPDFIVALKDVSVTIPQAVKRGSNALLQCNYDMENDTLYSVKWYKGRREFYRYTPKENPAMKVFPMTSGLNVERNLSNQSHVVLLAVPLSISGKFTCEISVEAPSFQTAMVSGEMDVVELPEEQATVTGIQARYRIGDLVDGNCSIKFSKPAANLTWTINGIVVPPHHIKTYQIEKHEDNNLESVVSAVHFMVTTTHFLKGQMRLKCTASIFDIFKEEIESIIEEDRPRIMASGRSYDINNYPYEQHSSGDGFEDHNESYLTYYSAADITSSAAPASGFFVLHTLRKHIQDFIAVQSSHMIQICTDICHYIRKTATSVNAAIILIAYCSAMQWQRYLRSCPNTQDVLSHDIVCTEEPTNDLSRKSFYNCHLKGTHNEGITNMIDSRNSQHFLGPDEHCQQRNDDAATTTIFIARNNVAGGIDGKINAHDCRSKLSVTYDAETGIAVCPSLPTAASPPFGAPASEGNFNEPPSDARHSKDQTILMALPPKKRHSAHFDLLTDGNMKFLRLSLVYSC